MRRMRTMLWAAVAVLGTASTTMAETLELRTGGTVAGEVRLEGEDAVIVDARFPEVKTVTLKRGDLTPESLYSVLERRIASGDAKARRELGELAEKLGLNGAAVAEFRAVKVLDPSTAKDMDAAVVRVYEALAAAMLADARGELDRGRARAAIRYLHMIIEKYPETKAADEAKVLMPKAHAAAGREVDVAEETVPAAKAPEVLDAAAKLLEKADEAFKPLRGHGGSSVKDQRTAERALLYYEAAWAQVKRLPVALEGDLADRVRRIRERSRTSLVEAYLTMGTLHLQRRSLPAAEENCNRACELDPENRDNHELHRLILEAKAYDYGYRSGGRGL